MSEQRPKALVVDDAPEFVEMVRSPLEADGFEVEVAASGEQALEIARSFDPDVVVLDLGLPGIDGVEVARQLRTFTGCYIVMLTVRDDEVDKLIGLSVGADDYLTKPFSPRELLARIKAMMRRPVKVAGPDPGATRTFGVLQIDTDAREVTLEGDPIALTKIEFDLLAALSSRPKVVFSRALLLDKVWGPDWYGDDHVVDVHIAELRKKLGDDPKRPTYVRTVRGVGYRMMPG